MYFDDLPFCIQVYKDGQVLEAYSDNNAAFYDRSYQMPTSPVQVFNMKFVAWNKKVGGLNCQKCKDLVIQDYLLQERESDQNVPVLLI